MIRRERHAPDMNIESDRPRVVIADDHAETGKRVTQLLQAEFDVVRRVEDGQTLIDGVKDLNPDVAIVDINMPGIDGFEAARQLKKSGCRTKVVFMTVHEDEDYLAEARLVGAHGYVLKSCMMTDLVPAIHEVLAGGFFVSPV